MTALCDGWLAQSPRFRLMCWGGWLLVLVMIAVLCLYPARQDQSSQREALEQQRTAMQLQWRNLYLLAVSVNRPLSLSEEKRIPFSPLVFQTPLTRLIHWRPSAQGGEMALKSAWDAVPPMFVRLAEQGMKVSQFSLSVEDTELLLTLQLERLNEG